MVVSCTTPSPPHLVDISDLYNKRLLVKLIKNDSHINYRGTLLVSGTTPSPPHLVDMSDLYNKRLLMKLIEKGLPHQLQRDNGSQLYHSFTSSSGRHIGHLQH